jgi:hypothetical protein
MRRLLPLLALVLIPFPATAHADGCPPSECGTTSFAPPGSSLFLFPSGRQGPLHVYDLRSGIRRLVLPAGMLSADGRTFVSAVQVKGGTRFFRFDPRTGSAQVLRRVPGIWSVAGVSADGRLIARFKFRKHAKGTTLTLDDRGRSQSIRLPGNYELESFSPDGRRLFLIHWNRTGGYKLEEYDRLSARLSPTRLDEPDEKMEGQAQAAVQKRDGSWLYTLYWKVNGETFVHALDLRTGLAHCIDLPLRGSVVSVGASALTLSPDDRRLYIASPLAGRVTTVELSTLAVSSTARFRPVPEANYVWGTGPSAAVSPNGRMLAFVAANKLWLMDTAYGVLRAPIRLGRATIGVGFAPGGRRVVTISGRSHADFDAATGRRL